MIVCYDYLCYDCLCYDCLCVRCIVQACTGGGCTVSNVSEITTSESAPGLIQKPSVTSPTPSQLHVEWLKPGLPNGKEGITKFSQPKTLVFHLLKSGSKF